MKWFIQIPWGQRVAGAKKDVKEVQNYHEVLDYLECLIEDTRHPFADGNGRTG